MAKYSEGTLRRKAYAAGYRMDKGFKHYVSNGCVTPERKTGYMVMDLTTGFYVWDSYNNYYDHAWNLEDVEQFLQGVYDEAGLKF